MAAGRAPAHRHHRRGRPAAGKSVGVCGEAAADPLLAVALIGMGITSLSMAGAAVRAVGAQLSAVSLVTCEQAARAALDAADPMAGRDAVRAVVAGRELPGYR